MGACYSPGMRHLPLGPSTHFASLAALAALAVLPACGAQDDAAADSAAADASATDARPDAGAPDRDGAAPVADAGPSVTYHHDVAPILATYCNRCHVAGGIAGLPLTTYAEAAAQAAAIEIGRAHV